MAKTLGTIKKYMNKSSRGLLRSPSDVHDLPGIVAGIHQIRPQQPAAFTEELVKYSLIWTGFIGAAYAFSTREHMALTLVRDKLTGRPHQILVIFIDALILSPCNLCNHDRRL